MTAETHSQLANFIWSICNLLRGPYKRNEYRKVIMPLTVLRRFDCLLAPTKEQVLAKYPKIKTKPETVVLSMLQKITGRPFYNLSKLDLPKLLDDPNQLAPNLNSYTNGFSPMHVGPLPDSCAMLTDLSARIEMMAVEGAISGNPRLVYQAIAHDPLTAAKLSLSEIKKMVTEMFRKNAKYLPQFKKIDL